MVFEIPSLCFHSYLDLHVRRPTRNGLVSRDCVVKQHGGNGIWFLGSLLEVHSSAVQSVVGHGERSNKAREGFEGRLRKLVASSLRRRRNTRL